MMKGIAAAVLLALTGQAAAAPAYKYPAGPQRIMSLRICTDELLLDLVAPSRIASVTFMSREPAALRRWPQGAQVAVNYGTAEEIVAAKPDLILTDPFMAPALRQILVRTGAKLLDVPPAENFDQIRAVTRLVARAVGEEKKGEVLLAQMDADLKVVAARRPATPIRIAEWGNGGYVPGTNGLFGAMLAAAGATSIVDGAMGYYDVEALLAANPQKLVYGDTYRGMASLRAEQDNHPALLKRYRERSVRYASLYGCGVPQSGRVTRELQAALLGIKP